MSYRDPDFLREHIRSIISFYHPACIDSEYGGYINQMRDDGSVFDRMTKHLVGTCRFVFCYSVASLSLNEPPTEMLLHMGCDASRRCTGSRTADSPGY